MTQTGEPSGPSEGVILVVDDRPLVLDIARRLLETTGFVVHDASCGREAIRVFRERSGEIDCVLLDLEMPDMTGETTYAALKRIRSDVKVIFSSGCEEDEIRPLIEDDENAEYVQKPYRLKTLKALVRRLLDGSGPDREPARPGEPQLPEPRTRLPAGTRSIRPDAAPPMDGQGRRGSSATT